MCGGVCRRHLRRPDGDEFVAQSLEEARPRRREPPPFLNARLNRDLYRILSAKKSL